MLRVVALFFVALIGLLTHAGEAPGGIDPKDRIVVLISVDGLASYYLDDPLAHMPTIRKLAKNGASAKRMKTVLPSVTWPSHTSLVTGVHPGKHGVIGNSYLDRGTAKSVALIPDPLFDKAEIVKVPTVYDVVHQAGLKTAGVIWPASRNASTLNWQMPDVFADELFQKYSTPGLLAELKAAGIPTDLQQTWCKENKGVQRDWMYASAAAYIIKKYKPNFLALHLVEVDHIEHAKGPQTPEAYWACNYADDRVRQVLDACEEAFPGKATIFVCADHGFIPYLQQIQPNVKLRLDGLAKNGDKQAVQALGQGGASFVYILDKERRAELLPKVVASLKDVEGVELLVEEKDFAQHGLVTPDKDARMADLVLTAKVGYTFSDMAMGEVVVTPKGESLKGSHGHDPNNPLMYATCVAWGAGIKPGASADEIKNLDIAPTIARLLGLEMKDVDGRVLEEFLTK